MSSDFYSLKCISCSKIANEKLHYTTCPHCDGALEVSLDYDVLAERLNLHMLRAMPPTATKYIDLYPIKDKRKTITLDEGGTPLYHCKNLGKKLGLKSLYIKHEGANPTGAFKDRGTMVEITKALELDKKAVVVASSGNMAASVSAYCAKANLPVYVLVPQGTPVGKLSQTLAYGARIIQIRGTYDSAAELTKEISKKHDFFLAGDYAFRLEGQKSQAYEIAEQLSWRAPDRVFIPIGCGTNGSAIWKGFKEYKCFGLIDSLPKMVGIQAQGADPVVRAFTQHRSEVLPISNPQTVATAICVGNPLDGTKMIHALKESKGSAMSVKDDCTLEAEKLLAKTESIFVEPSSATTLAALQSMLDQGSVNKDETIVMVLTGAGLKDPLSALKVLYSPPVIDPVFTEVEKYLNYGFYDVVAARSHEKKVLLDKIPSLNEMEKLIKKEFRISLDHEDLAICSELVKAFLQKGKKIQKGDLQYILEKTLRQSNREEREKCLQILDFSVKAVKYKKSIGIVKLNYEGKIEKVEAEGVGPVDGVLNAITKVLDKKGFAFELIDYQVTIAEGGTEASVKVKMTLEDNKRNKVIAMGTSPDIIVASVEAFEEGFNLLYLKRTLKN